MAKQKIGELYKCFHEKLINRAMRSNTSEIMILDKQDLIYLLGAMLHVKKENMKKVIQEMVEYGLIIQVSRGRAGTKYRILGC